MCHTKRIPVRRIDHMENEASLYRLRFPFPMPKGAKCIHYEENTELSLRIYQTEGEACFFQWDRAPLLTSDHSRREKMLIRTERRAVIEETKTDIRLFSEGRINASEERIESENAYYTLHICNEKRVLLFRAFSKNKALAERLFESVCAEKTDCVSALDIYRECRERILREIWHLGL